MRRPFTLALALAGLCSSAAAANTFVQLPVPGFPSRLTPDGTGLVGVGDTGYLWTVASGFSYLPRLDNNGSSWAEGISADKSLIVGIHRGPNSGMIWQNGVPSKVFPFNYCEITHLTPDGKIWTGYSNAYWPDEGFRYANGHLQLLGVNGGLTTTPSTISEDGTAISGDLQLPNDTYVPFYWTTTGGMQRIPSFPDVDDGGFAFNFVTPDGKTVFGDLFSPGGIEPIKWNSTGGLVGLGPLLDSSNQDGEFLCSNFDGSVLAGGFYTNEAAIWTEQTGYVKLRNLLLHTGTPGLTGWKLDMVYCMSRDGHTIVGMGNGHTFMATLDYPLPPTFGISQTGSGAAAAGALSSDGSAEALTNSSTHAGYVWRYNTGLTPIGKLPGDTRSGATAAGGLGTTVVGFSEGPAGKQAVRWTESGGLQALGQLGGMVSTATAVSENGGTVVGNAKSGSGYSAFIWTESSPMQQLFPLGPGQSSFATGLSSDGSKVVGYVSTSAGHQPFFWTSSGTTFLQNGAMAMKGEVNGISEDGAYLVGGASFGTAHQAFLYKVSTGAVTNLGVLPGDTSSDAVAVSTDGKTVVGNSRSGNVQRPFIWFASTGMVALSDYFSANISGAQNWTLTSVTDVSFDGEVISGTGKLSGGAETTWRATIVGPCVLNGATLIGTGQGVASTNFAHGGSQFKGSVQLTRRAGANGVTLNLATTDTDVLSIPSQVTVPPGAWYATFPIGTQKVVSNRAVTISTSDGFVTRPIAFTLKPGPAIASVAVTPLQVLGGNTGKVTVTLRDPAPAGGVTLSNNIGVGASGPSTVTIPGGATTASFNITTVPVGVYKVVQLTVQDTRTAFDVLPPPLASVKLSQGTVSGGSNVPATISLSTPAPSGGAVVSLTSSNPSVASVPSTVTVPAGSKSVGFTLSTSAVAGSQRVVITASYLFKTATAALTVNP